jgi:hypothetical protein
MNDEPTTLRHIARELPRKRVALVLLLVVVNLGAMSYWRGLTISRFRYERMMIRYSDPPQRWTAPWEWTADEWAEVWPWSHRDCAAPFARPVINQTRYGLRIAAEEASALARNGSYGNAVFYVWEYHDETGAKGGSVLASQAERDASLRNYLVTDQWGHPIRLRVPGHVHAQGWDVWSCGPNGIDEQGQGDDILIGEDVAPVGTAQ